MRAKTAELAKMLQNIAKTEDTPSKSSA